MPVYHVTFAADRNAPYGQLDDLHKVDAESPLEAVRAALGTGREPIIGLAQLCARVIVGTNPDTGNWQVKCIPLDRVAVVP